MLSYRSFKISKNCWSSWMNVKGKHNTFKCFLYLQNMYRPYPDYIIWLHFIFSTWWFFSVASHPSDVFMAIRVRNERQSRLVIYVRESIEKTSWEHCLDTSPHIASTMSSPGCKIVILEQIKLPTHFLEFYQKCNRLPAHFYSIIGIVRRLPKTWYIICCVYNEQMLHKSA